MLAKPLVLLRLPVVLADAWIVAPAGVMRTTDGVTPARRPGEAPLPPPPRWDRRWRWSAPTPLTAGAPARRTRLPLRDHLGRLQLLRHPSSSAPRSSVNATTPQSAASCPHPYISRRGLEDLVGGAATTPWRNRRSACTRPSFEHRGPWRTRQRSSWPPWTTSAVQRTPAARRVRAMSHRSSTKRPTMQAWVSRPCPERNETISTEPGAVHPPTPPCAPAPTAGGRSRCPEVRGTFSQAPRTRGDRTAAGNARRLLRCPPPAGRVRTDREAGTRLCAHVRDCAAISSVLRLRRLPPVAASTVALDDHDVTRRNAIAAVAALPASQIELAAATSACGRHRNDAIKTGKGGRAERPLPPSSAEEGETNGHP